MSNDLKKCATIGTIRVPSYLLRAWTDLYKKTPKKQRNETTGIDNQSINNINDNLFDNLKLISRKILSEHGYQFSALKPVLVKKKNGKDRLICIPTVSDRIVQKSIQLVLQKTKKWKYCKYNGINFGFVKGKSVKDALNKAIKERRKNPYIYKTDISSFFDEIDRDKLKREISKKIRSSSLHPILQSIVDCEVSDSFINIKDRINKMGIKKGCGVRQGMPMSPLFANLFLIDFDDQMKRDSIRCVRYADDLLFFGDSTDKCNEIHKICKNELSKIDLDIPEIGSGNKTEILNPNEDVDFLGICISYDEEKGYHQVITVKQREAIRENILNFSNLDYLARNEITLRNYSLKLNSIISGYKGVYSQCIDIVDLEVKMSNWVRKALKKLLNEQFNLNFDTLSHKQKNFLDIL